MKIFKRIISLFKKSSLDVPLTTELQTQNEDDANKFHCHYCQHAFEVTARMQFPVSVPSTDGNYMFQGIGVQCPLCLKTCVYG